MVRAFTSRVSKETVSCTGSAPAGCPVLCDSVLMMRNGLLKIGVAERQQRQMFQLSSKNEKPQATRGQRRGNVPHTGPRAGGEFRASHPEEIDEAHKDEPDGNPGKQPGIALQVAREQQKERNEKVENHDDDRHNAPFAIETRAIEADLFGLVAGPDDQELGKVEIRPEHDKSQQQLSEVVNVAALQNAGKRPGARKQHDHGNHQRHGGNELSGYKQKTVDGGSPMRRQGHHPVDGGKGHYEDIEYDAWARDHFHAAAYRQIIVVGVLLARPAIEQEYQNPPNGEINNGANAEAAGGQIALLEFRKRPFSGSGRVEPSGIEILHAEQDGDEQNRDDDERARRGFQRPANHDTPISAGEMLHHEQAQGSQRQAQHKHKGEKIGGIELLRPLDGPDEANHHANQADDQRALPEAIDAFRRFVVLPVHSFVPPGVSGALPFLLAAGGCKTFSRTSAGKSATRALRLSCRART